MSRYPREVLETYIRGDKGLIYQLVPHKVEGYLYMRRGNNYKGMVKKEIAQKVVNGTWRHPNEAELHKFITEDNKVIYHINQLILKRVLLVQILIEVDDELIPHFLDDNRARNLLKKSQDHLNRKNMHLFNRLYKEDEEMAQNMLKAFDKFTSAISKKRPQELYRLADHILKIEEDPSILDDTVELDKIDAKEEKG